MTPNQDALHLHQALELAKLKRGYCSPNPSVGAVIVQNNTIIATGFHQGPGTDHAEIVALKKITKDEAKDATIYVTLEPCCHFGRTPPCTNALIQAGIKRVVYGYADPNPIVAGKGHQALNAADILCEQLTLPEINLFYEPYHHWHATKKPYVTAKIALSMDGKIAGNHGEPIAITGEAINEFTHYSRAHHDAILTTSRTILQDDPQLNVRINEEIFAKPLYILDRQLKLPTTAKVFQTAKSITLFHEENAASENKARLIHQGVRCVPIEATKEGLNLEQVIEMIGKDGIHALWVEAGGECFASLVKQRLLQSAYLYIAPKWLGNGKNAFPAEFELDLAGTQLQWQQFGKDVLCQIRW